MSYEVSRAKIFIGNILNRIERDGYGPEVALLRRILRLSKMDISEWLDIYKEIKEQYPEKVEI